MAFGALEELVGPSRIPKGAPRIGEFFERLTHAEGGRVALVATANPSTLSFQACS